MSKPRRTSPDNDSIILLAPARPLIPPGIYEAVSASVERRRLPGRSYLEMRFTVYAGHITDGEVLETGIPMFVNLGNGAGKPMGPASKMSRMVQLLAPPDPTKVTYQDLRNKAWRVRVITVTEDHLHRPLPKANHYSKVEAVLERLA